MELHKRIVLGAWLTGSHLEDTKYFTADDFRDAKMPDAIKEILAGSDLLKINSKLRLSGVKLAELAGYESDYTGRYDPDTGYNQAKRECFLEKARLRISADFADGKETWDILQNAVSMRDLISGTGVALPERATGAGNIFEKMLERNKTSDTVTWGLPFLDHLTGGIHRQELTTIAARPNIGKSAFALQAAMRAAERGEKVLFFSLEMSIEQMITRMILREGLANELQIKMGEVQNREKIQKLLDEFDNGNLHMYMAINSLDDIERLTQIEKPFMVVIDQLTQVRPKGKFLNERERLQEITNRLKRLSLVCDVAVLLLCQLNREATDTKASLHHLKSSGQTEEDSDNVILLSPLAKSQSAYELADYEVPIFLELAKHRNGKKGEKEIILYAERMKFFEPARR